VTGDLEITLDTTHTENPPTSSHFNTRNLLVIASPVVIIAIGSLAARVSIQLFKQWAWAGTFPIYWGSMALVILAVSGQERLASWFGRSLGSLIWPALAIFTALSAFPLLLLPNLHHLRSPLLIILWIAFALINGTVEESYWRGFLLKEIQAWPTWITVIYSSVLFILIHFLMIGAFAPALFNLPFLLILTWITLLMAVMFLCTGSLRWPAISHILTDLGNMNIFVFMNLIKFF
jgi:membrane protease YdiL (CAAX protease family)